MTVEQALNTLAFLNAHILLRDQMNHSHDANFLEMEDMGFDRFELREWNYFACDMMSYWSNIFE